jgi:hypothetical protein
MINNFLATNYKYQRKMNIKKKSAEQEILFGTRLIISFFLICC